MSGDKDKRAEAQAKYEELETLETTRRRKRDIASLKQRLEEKSKEDAEVDSAVRNINALLPEVSRENIANILSNNYTYSETTLDDVHSLFKKLGEALNTDITSINTPTEEEEISELKNQFDAKTTKLKIDKPWYEWIARAFYSFMAWMGLKRETDYQKEIDELRPTIPEKILELLKLASEISIKAEPPAAERAVAAAAGAAAPIPTGEGLGPSRTSASLSTTTPPPHAPSTPEP